MYVKRKIEEIHLRKILIIHLGQYLENDTPSNCFFTGKYIKCTR